jgi:hypothetical protein
MNKATQGAGLCFDAMVRKKWINEYYEQNNMIININDNDNDNDNVVENGDNNIEILPSINNFHIGIACVEQVMLDVIITECLKKCKLSVCGVYIMDYNLISNTILQEPKLNKTFNSEILNNYDPKINYKHLIKIKDHKGRENEIVKYIDDKKKKIDFLRCAENFISFLFYNTRTKLADICYKLIKYAKKRCINYETVKYAVMIYYPENSDFLNMTLQKIANAEISINNAKNVKRYREYEKYEKDAKRGYEEYKKFAGIYDSDEEEPVKINKKVKKYDSDEEEPVKINKKVKKYDSDEEEPAKINNKVKKYDSDEEEPVKINNKVKKYDSDEEEPVKINKKVKKYY